MDTNIPQEITLCSEHWAEVLKPGIYRCVIPRDELRTRGYVCGEAAREPYVKGSCKAYVFELKNSLAEEGVCLTRGSIKIGGLEYGIFTINGDKATLELYPTPWQDAIMEYELGPCKK